MSAADEATTLTKLISSTTAAILDEYKSKGKTLPALSEAVKGPFDLPEDSSFELVNNLKTVEAACHQLIALLAPPGHNVINKSFGHIESACLRVAIDAKIADLLLDKPAGLSVADLSSKSGVNAGKLYRILRLLASKHVFSELKPEVFANNRLSLKLVSTEPLAGYVGHSTGESAKGFSYLSETVTDSKLTDGVSPGDAPFSQAFKVNCFDFYGQNPSYGLRFNQAMIGWGEVTGRAMLARVYPWDSVKEDTTIVDVGGSNGHVMLTLLESHPKLKAVVQDTPQVIEDGIKMWEKENPGALQSKRAQLLPTNFFEDAPFQGADIYYLRHVLHDWPNAEAQKILANVRKAMTANKSKLLIHELSPQSVARIEAPDFPQAPEPLLPNYGVAKARSYYMDMQMMTMLNSLERTPAMFKELVEPMGFRFEKLHGEGEISLLEFVAV